MIPLGFTTANEKKSIGFRSSAANITQTLVTDAGEASLITFAPTGSGKGTGSVIPTCLSYEGSMIVVDPKGEAAQVTASTRRNYGEVFIIDPFKIVTDTPDCFNPLDIGRAGSYEQQGAMLARALQGEGVTSGADPYWDQAANSLLTGLVIHELTQERSFFNLRKNLHQYHMELELAKLLDSKAVTSPLASELLGGFLSVTAEVTRSCILSVARQSLALLGDPGVMESLSKTSFSIEDLLDGKTTTIYIVIPPNQLNAFSSLLRIWVTAFIFLLTERKQQPSIPTLLLLDECGNLGRLQSLTTAITLMRSFGLRIWCYFQDINQLKQLYPAEWVTIINNCDVVMAFGIRTFLMAKELEGIIGGINTATLLRLSPSDAVLLRPNTPPTIIRRCNYRTDSLFQQYEYKPNPMYDCKFLPDAQGITAS